jgi:hypothetical protein
VGRHAAGTGPAQTPGGSVSPRGAIWADLTGAPFSRDPATGDDKSLGGAAARRAHGNGNPCAIETADATAATTAFSRRPARLIGFRFGATRRPGGFDRAGLLARTGQRFFVIADAAAGAAGLRHGRAGYGDRDQQRVEGNSDRTLSRIFHNDLFQYFPVATSNRAIASMPSTFRCSRPIAGTSRRRCGRTAGRW